MTVVMSHSRGNSGSWTTLNREEWYLPSKSKDSNRLLDISR